jgi:hypothetical protein
MNDHLRLAERIGGMKRQKPRVTGSGTDEPDRTGIEFGKAGKKRIRHGLLLRAWRNI